MIIAIIGGVGSGKSLSGVKFMLERDTPLFTNFNIRNKPNIKRLRHDHIFKEIVLEISGRGKEKKGLTLNWDFWKSQLQENDGFDICIDEMHNLFNSRRSMSKENILLMQFVAQIRKILSGNENNHFTVISQRLERIDVSLRDLVGCVIYCQKYIDKSTLIDTYIYKNNKKYLKQLPKVYIIQYIFKGTYSVDNYQSFLMGGKTYDYRTRFVGNPYFQYYDSYDLIDTTGEYL